MATWKNLDTLASYSKLAELKGHVNIADAMAGEKGAERVKKYSTPMAAGLTYNYAAKQVDETVLDALAKLADEAELIDKFQELYNGAVINTGEKRMVLHHLARTQLGEDVVVDGVNKREFYVAQQKKAADFANKVHAGEITNENGEKFTTVVQIGIGGSDLGPRALYIALENWAKANNTSKMEAKFISNVDPDDAAAVLASVDLAHALFIVVSKSGTTLETLTNEAFVKNALVKAGLNPSKHMLAVTSETSPLAKSEDYLTSEWNRFFKDTELVKMKIGEIKPITLIRFFREATKDRQFTHKRVSNARSVLNGIMSYAIEEEIISHNPVSDVNFKQFTYKPVEVQSDNVFSRDDTHKLLNYLRCIIEPYSLAIQLSFYLFIRVGETKAIRWEDIDYNNRLVYLHRQATCERTLNDDLTFSSRKVKVVNQMKGNTSHGFRKQFLTDEALKILHKAKELNPNGIYVFEPNGEIMTTDSFNRRLKKYCKEAGVPYHSSHKIRFYNASTAFDGNNLTTLSYLMGHSETATTLHYLRNVNKRKNDRLAFQNLGISS